jgi:hypothetical protein
MVHLAQLIAEKGESYEERMMSEIYQRGPVACSIACPDELTYKYRGGVYIDHSNSTGDDVDHDIEVRHFRRCDFAVTSIAAQ